MVPRMVPRLIVIAFRNQGVDQGQDRRFHTQDPILNYARQAKGNTKYMFQWPVLNHVVMQPKWTLKSSWLGFTSTAPNPFLRPLVRLNKFRLWHAPAVQMACFNDRFDFRKDFDGKYGSSCHPNVLFCFLLQSSIVTNRQEHSKYFTPHYRIILR